MLYWPTSIAVNGFLNNIAAVLFSDDGHCAYIGSQVYTEVSVQVDIVHYARLVTEKAASEKMIDLNAEVDDRLDRVDEVAGVANRLDIYKVIDLS